MTEIKALSLFQGNPQSSDQKPDFWNSSTKQTQKGPGTKKSKKETMKQVQQLSCTSHEAAINNSKKTEWKKKDTSPMKKIWYVTWEEHQSKFSYIFSKRFFWKWNFQATKEFLTFQVGTFWAWKKKKHSNKKVVIFQEMMGLSRSKLKNLLKYENFYISFHIFCLLKENFSNISKK